MTLVVCVCEPAAGKFCMREACRGQRATVLTQCQAAAEPRPLLSCGECTVRLDRTSTVEGALRGSFLAASGAVAA